MPDADTSSWFEDTPVIGRLSRESAVLKLRELGEIEEADVTEAWLARSPGSERALSLSIPWPGRDPKAYEHTAHAFGHIPVGREGDDVEINQAGSIAADASLKGRRLKISLDRLRVADYPGGGVHHILFDFYARHQAKGHTEYIHFNQTFRVQEGEQAALIGFPIFVGLNVGNEGVEFKCYTVNVKNEDDEAFLTFLDSDVFKGGLQLVETAQPAIAPLAGMAVALTKMIARRNKNVPVQDFFMGLDFSEVVTGARLAQGSYVAVQIPESMEVGWNWSRWVYNKPSGRIVQRDDPTKLVPYNYVVLGVSAYES